MKANRIIARAGKAPTTAELAIYGDIGPSEWGMIDDRTFADELRKLGDVTALALRINSAGGSAFTGLSIYNQLMRHPARIDVHVDGVAASIASVIAMAGDSITMGRGAQMMIHDASTLAWGNAAEMQRTATLLESISDDLAQIYAERRGIATAKVRAWMRAETWFDADAAVAEKFADAITDGEMVQAHLEPDVAARFRHPPKSLLTPRQAVDAAREAATVMRVTNERRATVSTLAARAAVYRKEQTA